jgi:hypothetical protein
LSNRRGALQTPESYRYLSIQTKRRSRRERRKYRRLEREILRNKYYSQISKIDLSPQVVTYVFSITTTIFLLTGYTYNRVFLGYFDIDVPVFFSVGDYLSTSVDKIYFSVISVLIGLVYSLFGGYVESISMIEDDYLEKTSRRKTRRTVYNLSIIIPWVFSTILMIVYFYLDKQGKYNLLGMSVYFVLVYILSELPIHRFFQKPFRVYLLFISFLIFSLSMYSSIMDQIETINRHDISDLKRYQFSYETGITFEDHSWVFLTGNSEYLFFYDKDDKKSFVIPKRYVKSVESIKK